jgi:hypothetical protein
VIPRLDEAALRCAEQALDPLTLRLGFALAIGDARCDPSSTPASKHTSTSNSHAHRSSMGCPTPGIVQPK